MSKSSDQITVALEVGQKRVFASASDWPGWTRNGRDEAAALQSLLDYGARYERAIRSAKLGFRAPTDRTKFVVIERLPGTSTTDFGAPDVASTHDRLPLEADTLRRLQSLLSACWKSLLTTIESASGKPLRKGPRGGGRELVGVFHHVVDAHYSYLRQISWSAARDEAGDIPTTLNAVARATREALAAAATGKTPERGPRGGVRWSPRYFVRRAAWHVLDHVWEIEDRVQQNQ
ncbi:MAG: DinB family protein [Anaerolineales bacterium]